MGQENETRCKNQNADKLISISTYLSYVILMTADHLNICKTIIIAKFLIFWK